MLPRIEKLLDIRFQMLQMKISNEQLEERDRERTYAAEELRIEGAGHGWPGLRPAGRSRDIGWTGEAKTHDIQGM